MKSIFLVLILASMGLLNACTPPEPLDFSQDSVTPVQHKINCKLQSIAVSIENDADFGNGDYGTRPAALAEIREPMRSALEDGLDRSAVFDYGSPSSCAVEAKVLGIKYQTFGATFPTDIYVDYEISSLDSGHRLLSDIITGHGETPMSYNFLGVVRSRHSIILSGKDAVSGMIVTTEQFADIESKPEQKRFQP
jgi:hypothetical protein